LAAHRRDWSDDRHVRGAHCAAGATARRFSGDQNSSLPAEFATM
jgi:hypothetical protein